MMKKFAPVLVMMIILCASCAGAYTISGDTYILESDSDFRTVMADTSITTAGKYFLLSCDVQLAAYSDWAGIGTKDNPFNGHFDGQGHTVYVNIWPLPGMASTYTPILTDRGLFGYVNTSSEYAVKNLKVEGSVRGYNAGGIVSVLEAGTIENCSFSGDVIAQTRAGDAVIDNLIDELGDDDVQDVDDVERFDDAATNKVEHRRKINAGGIVGVIEDGEIIDCTARGNVTAESNLTPANAGGIVGKMFDGNITGCYVEGDTVITASTAGTTTSVFANAGGIAGYSVTPLASVIENCRFDGIVSSTYYAGGIAGETRGTVLSGDVISSTATISADYSAGGIAGYMASGGWATYNYVYGGAKVQAETYSAGGIIGLLETSGRAVENNTSHATIGGNAQYLGGIVGALGNNTYSGVAIGENNIYSGADYGIGRDEWGDPSDGNDAAYYISTTSFTAVSGDAFSASLSLNKTPATNVTWSFGTLPDGLTATSSGSLSWTPENAGTYTFTASAYISGYGSTDSKDITITVSASGGGTSDGVVTITTTALNSGTQDVSYAAYLRANSTISGGTLSWEIIDGDLPTGLELSTADAWYGYRGEITGTPTVSGLFSFTVRAIMTVSNNTYYATQALNLYIAPTPSLVISTDEILPDAALRRSYSADLEVYSTQTGSTVSARWTLTDGALPDGLTLNRITGMISGTPSESGEFTFTVSVTDGTLTTEKTFTLYVNDADFNITSGSLLKPGIVGTDYGGETLSTDAPSSLGTRTWYVYSGSLPSGLTLGRNTGIISGIPTEEGTFTFIVRLMIGDQITSKSFTITIIPGVSETGFTITTSSLVPAIAGREYTQTLSTDAPASPDVRVWYIDSGNFPSGLNLSRATGRIYGVPEESGSYTFTVNLFNGEQIASKTFTLTIIPGSSESGISITTESLSPGVEGREYTQTLGSDASSSEAQIWYVDDGTLPPGLSISRNTGVISGTPTAAGEYTFRVRLLIENQITARTYTVLIISGLAISADTLPDGKEGVNYEYEFSAGMDDAAVWTIVDGALPVGLSMSSGGVISGTPTRAGEYTFTVRAEVSAEGLKSEQTFSITIRPEFSILTDAALPGAKTGQWYYAALSADAEAVYSVSWSLLDGDLPPGLALSSTTGIISGTPTQDGTYTFTIQATAGRFIAAKTFTLTVGEVLEILTDATLQTGKTGVYYSCSFTTDSEYPVLWTLTDGSIPSGLAFSGGTLSGTPDTEGTYTFTLSAESGGLSADKTFSLTISGALSIITPSVLPAAKLGAYYSYTLSSDAPEGSEVLWSQVLSSMYDHTDEGSVYNPHYDFPEGMYIEETTGRIYGIPTSEEGVYRIRIQAVSGDFSTTKDFTLTVRPTLSIMTDRVLPDALTNEVYSVSLLSDADDDDVVTWSLVDSALPAGLTLDTQTGIISGYPLTEGTYTFTVQAMMNGLTAQKEFELTAGEVMIILTPEIPSIIKAGDSFSITLQTDKDDSTASSWSVAEGIIPPGLTLDTQTGEISGIPSRAGTYTFTVRNESGYSSAEKSLTLTVDFVISSDSYIEFQAGEFCSYKFSAEGVSAGAVLWTTSSDVLPSGLSLSREGLLSGTTSETGTYTFSVYAFVSNDVSAMKSVRLMVSTTAQIAILTARLPDGKVSQDYYAELDAAVDGVVWSKDEGIIPPGLTLYTNGVISGVPEESGRFSFSVRAETGERTGIKELSITITPADVKISDDFSGSGGGGGCDSGFCLFTLIIPFMRRRRH